MRSTGSCDGIHSVAERSYPPSEVRGRSWEDPMPKGRRPRGVIPRPRSGATAESARLRLRRNGREELPHIQGQGRRPGGATLRLRSGSAAERSYPASQVKGSSRECQAATAQEQPRGATPCSTSGAVAGRSYPTSKEQWLHGEGLEELLHVQAQEGQQ